MKQFRTLFGMKPGWRARFHDDAVILLHPDHKPYCIALGTIKDGEVLPRDTDKPLDLTDNPRTI